MNVRRRTARTTVALATAALALGLSSCGFDSPTGMVYNPPVGVNEQAGDVDVLNALIVKRESTSDAGALVATLVNQKDEEDQLTGVTAEGDDQGATIQLPGSIDIPSAGLVNLAEEELVEVSGETVQDGNFVTMTFQFANGESATLDVPVLIQGEGYFEDVRTP